LLLTPRTRRTRSQSGSVAATSCQLGGVDVDRCARDPVLDHGREGGADLAGPLRVVDELRDDAHDGRRRRCMRRLNPYPCGLQFADPHVDGAALMPVPPMSTPKRMLSSATLSSWSCRTQPPRAAYHDDTSRRHIATSSRQASAQGLWKQRAPAGSRYPAPRGDILRKVTRAPARVLPLVDGFGRAATDLRVSLTDRCNLRCTYCMPAEGLPWLPSPELLTDDELVRLIGIATERLGVTEVRLTGGEPTLRPTLVSLVSRLAALPQRPQLSLTTNGLTLPRLAEPLALAGLDRVNVSLDTTDRETFRRITRRDRLDDVVAGLAAAAKAGLLPVKVNAVLLRGVNDDDVVDLLTWCRERGYQLRIIEQMPLDAQHGWDRNQMVTAAETRTRLSAAHVLTPVPGRGSAPAETFLVDGGPDTVGIIASVTEPFCAACGLRPGPAHGRRAGPRLLVRPYRERPADRPARRSRRRRTRHPLVEGRCGQARRAWHRRPLVRPAGTVHVRHRWMRASRLRRTTSTSCYLPAAAAPDSAARTRRSWRSAGNG